MLCERREITPTEKPRVSDLALCLHARLVELADEIEDRWKRSVNGIFEGHGGREGASRLAGTARMRRRVIYRLRSQRVRPLGDCRRVSIPLPLRGYAKCPDGGDVCRGADSCGGLSDRTT